MAEHRAVPPKLAIAHPTLRPQVLGSSRPYPIFAPTSRLSSFSPSLSPTPSKRIRSPEGPLWLFTLVHFLTLYSLNRPFSSSTNSPPLAPFTFFAVLASGLFLNALYRSWNGRPVLPSQWGFLLASGGVLAISYLLRFEGLRSCGPLESIFSEFAGALAAKVVFLSVNKTSGTARKARGVVALLVGVFLLSQGWARASCSPLAVDVGYRTRASTVNELRNCPKVWSILAPSVAGFLTIIQQSMGAGAPLRSLGKRRVHVLSYATAAFLLLPFAILQLTLVSGQSHWEMSKSLLLLSSIAAFGMVIAFFGNFYAEEKLLMPSYSFKAFQIMACVVCGLELLYGLDISLAGFLFCSFVLVIGVQELAVLPGQMSWEALGETEYSTSVYASWIRSPLKHIMSDNKSRKIAIFFLINTVFMIIEFFYGFLSNSLGLISDACHMLFDCAALGIGLYASYISRLPENSKFNYGYGRFEVVSGYANAVLLVLVASLIVLESIERILEPPEISTESLLLVSIGGLLVNVVGLVFFHEEHHHAHGSGGGCSHSHSSHEVKKSPKIGLHGGVVVSDHSLVTCDATRMDSDDHHDCENAKISTNSGKAWTVYPHYGHSCGQGHQNSLAHQQIMLSASVHETKQGQNDNYEHSNDWHQDHEFCDTGNHLNQQQDGQLHHDGDHKPDLGDNKSQQQHLNHNHDHGEHHGHCHDNAHKHDHDKHHGCSQDHNYNHDHDKHHGNCHDHIHDHQRGHFHGHDHDHHKDIHSHQDHNHHHHPHMDHNMYGIFLHVLADTLGSVGVVISTILIKYKGWLITDPACSIILSALIIASVIPLLRNSAEILLQRVPRNTENGLKRALKDISMLAGVNNSQQMHVWSFTNTNIIGSLHLQISAGSNKMLIRENALRLLHEAGVVDLTLQIEEA